jgi:hypothetical protein
MMGLWFTKRYLVPYIRIGYLAVELLLLLRECLGHSLCCLFLLLPYVVSLKEGLNGAHHCCEVCIKKPRLFWEVGVNCSTLIYLGGLFLCCIMQQPKTSFELRIVHNLQLTY